MSTTVDSKVVEMRFDNKQFEKGVSETMSTIDKLKQGLKFTGATKGFENIASAVKNMDMTNLNNAIEQVRVKFSALQVMATTALANITNSAMNAGKKIVSAFTIDPIKSGFQEYETQINAVQTILANTKSKGATLEDVNRILDELNSYADKTIYNFTEMTRNIGTFTAAGVDLEVSANAIQGIANLAAVSGSTSQQASTAMYQLSQALASGTVKLMDWNSVVNAGMGGQVFQDALKETARVHGVAIDDMIDKQGSFRETLSEGWLTSEILTETLQKFTMATDDLTEAEIAQNREMLKSKGYTDEQIDAIFELGNTATNAATKVKTFTQLFDTLKEAAQSGWTQTWEILIGDFEEAKELFTGISDFIGGFINSMSEARNKLLEGALGSSPFGKLAEKINEATGATKGFSKSLEEHEAVVSSVIRGDWGNMEPRWEALTAAGYDCWIVQDMVNEQLGSSVRYYEDSAEARKKLTAATSQSIEELIKMSDAQLENLGFTKAEIAKLRELAKQSEMTGISISELVKDLGQLNGRTLLINSFKNLGQSLVKIFTALGQAYREVFPAMTSDQLYNIIAAFHKLTTYLVMNDETAENLKKTFKGVFAVLNIMWTTVKGVASIFAKLLGVIAPVGGSLLDTILGFTGNIGEFLAGVSEAYRELDIFNKTADKLVGILGPVIRTLRDLAATIKDSVVGTFEDLKVISFSDIVNQIKTSFTNLKNTISSMTFEDFKEIGGNMIDGLTKGIGDRISAIKNTVIEFCTKVIDTVKDIFGIHSPSVVFEQIGGFIVEGFKAGIGGLVTIVTSVFDAVETLVIDFIDTLKNIVDGVGIGSIFDGILTALSNLDFTKIFTTLFGIMGSMITGLINAISQMINDGTLFNIVSLIGETLKGLLTFNIAGLVKSITGITDGVGGILAPFAEIGEKIDKLLKGLGKSLTGFIDSLAAQNKAAALNMIAKSIALLAVAVIALSFVDPDKTTEGLLALGGVIAELGVFIKTSGIQNLAPKLGSSLLALSFALVILSGVMAIMGNMDEDTIAKGLLAIGGTLGVLASGLKLMPNREDFIKIAGSIWILSYALLTLSAVVAIFGSMSLGTLAKGIIAMGASLAAIGGALKLMPERDDLLMISFSMVVLSSALLVLAGAVGAMGSMSLGTIVKGVIGIGLAVAALGGALHLMPKREDLFNIAISMVILSSALVILANAIETLGNMSLGGVIQGLLAMDFALATIIVTLKKMPKGDEMLKISSSMVILSSALVILANVVKTLGNLSIGTLVKGLLSMSVAVRIIVEAFNEIKPQDIINKALAFVIISSALLMLSGVLAAMGNMSLEVLAKGLLAMGVALAELVIALNLMKGTISGAAAIFIVATALGILTPVLLTLGLSAPVAALGLLVIAGAFTVLGIAAYALAPVTPIVFVLAHCIGILGVACLNAGAGLMLFATAMTLLGLVGKAGADVLTIALSGLLGLIPLFFVKVGEGIIEFANLIGNAAPTLIGAVVNLVVSIVTSLLSAIQTMVPALFTTLGVILDELIAFLWEYIPSLIDLGLGLLLSLLQGIRDNMFEITTTAVEIVTELIDGIADKIDDVIDSGINLILQFINGLAAGIEKHTEPMKEAVFNLIAAIVGIIGIDLHMIRDKAKEIIDNVKEGISSTIYKVKEKAKEIITNVVDGIKSTIYKVKNKAKEIITNVKEGITSKITEIKDKAKEVITKFREGLSSNFYKVKNKAKEIVPKVVEGIKEKFTTVKTAAKDMMEGFVEGIKEKFEDIKNAAINVISGAVDKVKDFLGIKSPSRLFMEIGRYSDEGFANGLTKFAGAVADSALGVGETAVDAMSDSLSSVSDIPLDDIDAQPTITPVLDLSEIQNGANAMNGMFSNPKLAIAGFNANADALAKMMAQHETTKTSNKDIVEAVGKLRGDVGDLADAITKMKIFMDGDVVVGQLISKIDNALGRIVNHKGRGN